MNDPRNDLRRSIGHTPERTLHRIVQRTGHVVTEGQIETAGKAYVKATVWTMAADLVLDGLRLVGRTLWTVATVLALGAFGLWAWKHWPAILRWL